jgi:hypothetical protein
VHGAEHAARGGQPVRLGVARDPEVGHDRPAGRALDHDVLRLHVAVHDPSRMGVRERPGHLAEPWNHVRGRQRAACLHPLRQTLSVNVPHHEEGQPVGFVGAIDRHDVGVRQLRRGPGLAKEALAPFVVGD